ncbi:RrF2 family transcriptional regulator [Mucilaginibacter sp.]
MLSKKTKYAIKALIIMGKNTDKPPMQIAQIAELERIPKKFLESILLEMRNHGFLYSKKGSGGGYALNKSPKEIFLSEILRLTDGPIAMVPCASLNFYHKCDECRDEVTCGIRAMFIDIRDSTLKILAETTIADLIERESTLGASILSM